MSGFQVGTATRDITPAYPIWAHGYSGRSDKSHGVREPLSLGVLALKSGHETVLFITLDMIGVRVDVCDRLYEVLRRETGLGFPNVMISGSHTHFAPALHRTSFSSPEIGTVDPDPDFVADVEEKLVHAAHEALRSARPCQLETARMRVPQTLFNRRTRIADGTVRNCLLYPEDSTPYEFLPVDDQLTVLRMVNDGGVQAVLVNLGCHPVTGCSPAEDNYRYSSDYPFYVRKEVAEAWRCPVFFTLGAAGDAVPINRGSDVRERLGAVLGNSVVLAERTFRQDPVQALRTAVVEVQAETIIKTNLATVKAEYEAAKQTALALNDTPNSPEAKAARQAYDRTMMACGRSRLYPTNTFTVRIQIVHVGETVFVALPFEVLSEISLAMKERVPNSVLVSCAGGYQGYLPLAHEYDRGGYEASEGSTHFKPGTADRILNAILEHLS
ncbi:MAG: hypothetical protein HN742_15220 [Lentisphaerae bacterium]|jgi:neutral ceramidase|nr:hypothetical protein [Lentisphaerota bacterium]MBT4817114.1 hypothetical protein [Lentisphaerota bacterium]MBT5608510.1 hypothetical protein [Lentisphaerota bacterium]MBT7843227.1 hypothetical protein [Lentisphaerota bacterium]